MNGKTLLLIDGSSMLKGAFYGLPAGSAGGIRNLITKFLESEETGYLAAVFCCEEETLAPEGLKKEQEALKKILSYMNIPVFHEESRSGADMIASLAKEGKQEAGKIVILSEDKKLLQVVTEQAVLKMPVLGENALELKEYSPEAIKAEYGLEPTDLKDVSALTGSWGIGEKTACRLVKQFQNIENLYSHLEEVGSRRIREILSDRREEIEKKKKAETLKTDCRIQLDEVKTLAEKMFAKGGYSEENENSEKTVKKEEDEFTEIGAEENPFLEDELDAEEEHVSFAAENNGFFADEAAPPIESGFHLITSISEAEAIFEKCRENSKLGLQLIAEEKSITALALALSETQCFCMIPREALTSDYLAEKAEKICKRSSHVTVLHLKEQLGFLKLSPESAVFDAGVAAYLLNPLKDSYEYDGLAKDYLGLTLPSRAELIGKASLKRALEENEEKAVSCVCYMAYAALKCGDKLREGLKEMGMEKLFYEIETPLIYSLFSMESVGIRVEKDRLKEYGDRLKVRISEVEQKIYKETGETFNINSPKQLGEVLFGHMELPGGKKTKTGYSTAAEVLEKLAPDYPVVEMILDYRQLTKLNSTYADGLAAYIGPDGRIHGTFNQTIAATGRLSSTEPNLQNIPVRVELGREIRKVFVPKDGCVFVDADYSQIELRVLAHMSGDQRLIDAYRQAQDIHAITASQVFHTPLAEVTALQRRNAKAVNFGIVYGISSFGLSEGLSITMQEASEYINKYFETYPEVKSFLDRLVAEAKERGYAVSMFGRRRPVPELKSSNYMQRSFGERVAMNSPIQGTAADIIKIAMIRVDKALKEQNLKSRIVLQIHDELLIEAYRNELEKVKALLVEEMRHAADLEVPLEVDANVGDSWFDAK